MTTIVSLSHRTSDPAEVRMHMLKLAVFGLGFAVAVTARSVSVMASAGRVAAHLTAGLPLEKPNAFRRVRESDTWLRVGVFCFAAALFIHRKGEP